jgi:plastocyanin
MRVVLLAVCALVSAVAPVHGASVEATVRDEAGKPVEDAVVYVLVAPDASRKRSAPATVDQLKQEFVPYVLAVETGTAVTFPNNDNTRHHVYSFSSPKKFELPLYIGTPAAPVVFDKPGVVALGCNIHDWMSAYVLVLETPHFALTDADGVATLADLPPGEVAVEVWHPTLAGDPGATRRTAAADSTAEPLAFEIRQKRLWRAQRAAAHRDRYR